MGLGSHSPADRRPSGYGGAWICRGLEAQAVMLALGAPRDRGQLPLLTEGSSAGALAVGRTSVLCGNNDTNGVVHRGGPTEGPATQGGEDLGGSLADAVELFETAARMINAADSAEAATGNVNLPQTAAQHASAVTSVIPTGLETGATGSSQPHGGLPVLQHPRSGGKQVSLRLSSGSGG